jgi:hypothetical protein
MLPWLDVQNIFGRLYVTVASAQKFDEMAARGELAIHWRPPHPAKQADERKPKPLRKPAVKTKPAP